MSTKVAEEILQIAKTLDAFSMGELRSELNREISRQYLSLQLNQLISEGKLKKIGSGRWTRYMLPEQLHKYTQTVSAKLSNRANLDEYDVLVDLKEKNASLQNLPANISKILNYAFTEMLNNAIDHSRSKTITTEITLSRSEVGFRIRDYGVGIYSNIMKKRKLDSELNAIQELVKGKVTTMAKEHTGEGIFFTSRVADVFVIESHSYRYRVDNDLDDVFVEKISPKLRGTKISFVLSLNSKRKLVEIFDKYRADDEPEFSSTEIKILLYKENVEYISRSQAKRLLVGLDKFKRVILDFDKVDTVGQGFADEIFRVFQDKYPDIKLVPINMNEEVEFMVGRARDDRR